MLGINYWAIVVATVAAFVVSSVWYSPLLFGKVYLALRGLDPAATAEMAMPVGAILGELIRSLVVAYVLARFVVLLGVVNWMGAVQLGVWLWIGFPAVLLAGSVIWDKAPWLLAAIHAGDWLVKLLLMTVILGVWR